MPDQMITPPVANDIADVVKDAAPELSALQRLVRADKSSAVAAIVHVAVPLTAALSLHLDGQDVAVLTAIVSTGITYFVGLNFRTRSKLGK